jgi:hypothetical protein
MYEYDNGFLQVRSWSTIGGKTAELTAHRILRKLFSAELAIKLSLTGRGKCTEAGLKDKTIYKAIQGKLNDDLFGIHRIKETGMIGNEPLHYVMF